MHNQLAFTRYRHEKYGFNILKFSYIFLGGYLFIVVAKALLYEKKLSFLSAKDIFSVKYSEIKERENKLTVER